MKIVLIGPVYPYKGGISHYTGLLYKELSKFHEVTMISYSLQYPKLLFKKEQKDYSNDTFKIEKTYYGINTTMPFNWIKVAKNIGNISPDVVIIQWWHPYFAPCYCGIINRIKRICKTKILFTCHNIFPHERFPMDRKLVEMTLKKGDYFIVQSTKDEEDLKKLVNDAKYARAVHPTYNAFKMTDMSKGKAREILKISEDEKVLLFFGFVRKYKGLSILLSAMPQIINHNPKEKYRLLVVGDFGDDRQDYLDMINSLRISAYIDIHDGYIPDKEVEKFFAACDLVVLPYLSATQSGIVQIAYGFEKPVIASNVGGLPDVVLDGRTGYLVEPKKPEDIANAVSKFFEGNNAIVLRDGVNKESYRFSWEKMRKSIEMLCKTE